MEKPAKASGSQARDKRERAPRGHPKHPDALFEPSAEAAPHPEGGDFPDTGVMPTSLGVDAKLVVERGVHAGKVLKLSAGTVVIGRSSKCELSLKGAAGVSRRHCKVQLVGADFALLDLESRNGTQVNGVTQPRFILKDGDLIGVCDELIRFVSSSARSAPVARDSSSQQQDDINDRATQMLAARPRSEPGRVDERDDGVHDPDDGSDEHGFAAPPPTRAARGPSGRARRAPPKPPASDADHVRIQAGRAEPTASIAVPSFDPDTAIERDPLPLPPPPRARPRPPPLHDDETRLPPRAQAPSGGLRAAHVVLLLLVLVFGALAVAGWDLTLGDQRLLALVRSVQAQTSVADAGGNAATDEPHEPAGAAQGRADSAPDNAPDSAPDGAPDGPGPGTADAGPQAEVRAGDAGPDGMPTGEGGASSGTVDVTAPAVGTVARIAVSTGQRVKKGQLLVLVDRGGAGLRKKLDVLVGERRDFQAAVKKGIKSAARDLEAVEAEIGSIERKLRPSSVQAPSDGTVRDVLVAPGGAVKTGDVLVRLAP